MVFLAVLLAPFRSHASFDSSSLERYLRNKNNPWTTMALVAMGAGGIASDHLKNINASSAIEYEAPILAITALGQNPRTFGGVDYISKLKSYYKNNQIGEIDTLNDDFFGLLALVSAGENLNIPEISNTKDFVLSKQNADGGWGFTASSKSDSNMTAIGVVALVASGTNKTERKITNAIEYLKTSQNIDGGFGYSSGEASDSSSTAWAMWAFESAGIPQPTKQGKTPKNYLESNQTQDGYITYQTNSGQDAFTPITTAYASIALLGKTLPLKITQNTASEEFNFRIEGKTEQVCTGSALGPSALDLVKNAAVVCGFSYTIQEMSFGPYLKRINSDSAEGMIGWLYLVNLNSPDVGAGDYMLKKGDSVLWYYGDFNWKPGRLTLDSSEVASASGVNATVEQFQNGSWSPAKNAKVKFGASESETDIFGKVTFKPSDGYYKVIAEEGGIVRTEPVSLKVGNPTNGSIKLSLNIEGGNTTKEPDPKPQETIAFTINASNLDFGNLKAGAVSEKALDIKNIGSKAIRLETEVSGDTVFTENLKLDEMHWKKYSSGVIAGETKNMKAKISIPNNYSGSAGGKSATITLWASPQ